MPTATTKALICIAVSAAVNYWLTVPAAAQMIVAETPLTTISDSFYENNNIGFNFSLPGSGNIVGLGVDGQPTPNGNINFTFGGRTIPPFGGFDPNAQTRFGLAYLGKNGGSLGLNFSLGQGSDRTFTQTNPIIVLPSGGTGNVFDGSQRPFVTSIIPVIGDEVEPGAAVDPRPNRRRAPAGQPRAAPPPVKEISSAATADMSVAEIKRRKKYEREAELQALLDAAEQAETEEKLAVAKMLLRKAARRASGDRRREILDELERILREE